MAVAEEIMELVRLLDEEGFGALAGELLEELNLGGSADSYPDDHGEVPDAVESADIGSVSSATQIERALLFLRLRLIEPARRLAEAEKLAGDLVGDEAIPIAFVDADGVARERPRDKPGRFDAADKLEAALTRVMRSPLGAGGG